MTYQSAIDWLFNELPFFQQQGKDAYQPGLERILRLCNYLGNPQEKFKSIHIAGTNGKGSTAHMLAAIFQKHDFKVGLHTSPHLLAFEERNRINGKNTDKTFVKNFIEENKAIITELKCSFFEVAVALGFSYFAKNKVDIAIIETGLGGRLDATNVINPELSIITNIALEHTAILGDTLGKIAYEKAGIIKENTPIIIGEHNHETKEVFNAVAKQKNAPIYFVSSETPIRYSTDLKGIYQAKNLRTIQKALEILRLNGFSFQEEKIQAGLNEVTATTGLRGRWEVLNKKPLIIADTAHNPAGFSALIQQIYKIKASSKKMILGFVKDKDIQSILSLLPQEIEYYFCQPNIERKLNISELKSLTKQRFKSKYFNSVKSAINSAKEECSPDDFIFIGGSNFVVAEVLQILENQ